MTTGPAPVLLTYEAHRERRKMSNDLSRMMTALHVFVNSARSSLNRGNAQQDIENVLTLYAKDCELDGYVTGQELAAELKEYLRKKLGSV
jgi:hypothetical protein